MLALLEQVFDAGRMTWMADLQRPPSAEAAPPAQAALSLRVDRVRTFDTPEFAGMSFLEVQTKSALNRVRGMPFGWSINPYRGCSHACSYCLSGETTILMADGRNKPLRDVRPGDAVYGTVRRGAYRCYAITEVLDHWSTVKPACRVTLADGTQLVTSADHRFLTRRGWKHVTGADCGASRRPHLTGNDKLMGTGAPPDPPKHTTAYRRGYLCGMLRGDAHLGSYTYQRPGRGSGTVHRFRLALIDDDALQRARVYLYDAGVATDGFLFQAATEARKEMRAIRTSARLAVAAVHDVIAWPAQPCDDWAKGFLAGIFDAEGSYSCGVLRIVNSDAVIIDATTSALGRFGFRRTLETTPNGCQVVRLLGGLREQLRFFHLVDPAIERKRSIEGRAIKSDAPLGVAAIEPLGLDLPLFDITTGTGDFIAEGVVSHNCFARPTHSYLNLSPGEDFERKVVVKVNLAEVLRRELVRPSWRGEHVAMGTNTDPYQRCEGRYQLMPAVIQALAEARTPFSILTKGTLITRDLEALQTAAKLVSVGAALTIGLLDEDLWRAAEPGTPSPRARLAAVKALNEAGIPTGVMLAPIMPGLNDDRAQLAALTDAAVQAGAVHVTPIVLHLRPGVREVFWPWLQRHHPELVDRYGALYRRSDAPAEYRRGVGAFVADQRRAAWKRHGRPPVPPSWRGLSDDRRSPVAQEPAASGGSGPTAAAQLSLL